MIKPKIPENERERLHELKLYSILDTLSETDFDNLTAIASEICDTPISLISLIDAKRQWFKSHHGLAVTETPKEFAFCAHAINKPDDVLLVPDSRQDERFHDNPLVTSEPKVIFYAGVPLISENGFPLGTLCVIDHKPKLLSQNQLKSLAALGNQVMNLMELKKSQKLLEKALLNLGEKNQELESFATIAAHDLKSPLNNISRLVKLFTNGYGSSIDSDGHMMLNFIEKSSQKLKKLVEGLLKYSKNTCILNVPEKIMVEDLKNDIADLFSYDTKSTINLNSELVALYSNRTALDQILINLVSNAIKYNDKDFAEIEIGISEDERYYKFYVQDNGPGIEPDQHNKIFEIFKVLAENDRFGEPGNGIGLATVKKLVMALGGFIQVESQIGKGAKFMFTLEKS